MSVSSRLGLVALLVAPCAPFAGLAGLRPALSPSSRAALAPARLPALRRAAAVALAEEDEEAMGGAYRQLGITEDATYDEIMDAFMELSETYSDDTRRLGSLEAAKEKILDARLRQRMAGTGGPGVDRRDPFADKKVVRTPPWQVANAWRKKLILVPSPKYALQVFALLGGLSLASWISPSVAGTGTIVNLVGGMGFMYNRGEAEVPRDDFGQIGEIRPMQPKPFAFVGAIGFACFLWGWWTTKAMVAAGTAPTWLPAASLRMTLISWALLIPCLFLKVRGIFP